MKPYVLIGALMSSPTLDENYTTFNSEYTIQQDDPIIYHAGDDIKGEYTVHVEYKQDGSFTLYEVFDTGFNPNLSEEFFEECLQKSKKRIESLRGIIESSEGIEDWQIQSVGNHNPF